MQKKTGKNKNMKSFYIDSFNFFPEFCSPNMGSATIEKKGNRTFMSVNMTIMRYTNTGAPEGPGIYYGSDENSAEHSQAYYVIGEERLCEMAKALYDYVPNHATDEV